MNGKTIIRVTRRLRHVAIFALIGVTICAGVKLAAVRAEMEIADVEMREAHVEALTSEMVGITSELLLGLASASQGHGCDRVRLDQLRAKLVRIRGELETILADCREVRK